MSCFPCFGSKESESNEQEHFRVAQTKGHPSSQSPGMYACMHCFIQFALISICWYVY